MATTRYTSEAHNSPLSRIEFVNNSFGREDAILYANPASPGGSLQELPEKLKKRGMAAYADVRDGQQVLVVYGFKKQNHEQLLSTLRQENLVTDLNRPQKEQTADDKASGLQKFVKRYAIRLAAASGLLGHMCMGILSTVTGNKKFFGTAWKYTLADAVISVYGTDKSVTADPIMQDFKNHLWSQGQDASFVKARTDKITLGESANNFMKRNAFGIANAFGAMGNLNQIQIGIDDKDPGFMIAGATSMFGAGLQIFGSEKKVDPKQLERRGPIGKALSFIDTNPMQIAAATNFTDPFALFYSAANSKKLDERNLRNNNNDIHNELGKLSDAYLQLGNKLNIKTGAAVDDYKRYVEVTTSLQEQYKKEGFGLNFDWKKFKFRGKYDAGEVTKLQSELETLKTNFAGQTGLDSDGNPTKADGKLDKDGHLEDGMYNKAAGKEFKQVSDSIERIEELQQKNKQIRVGQKSGLKRILLFAVATFYTGATLLRFVAKKTASAEENKDAFNEVYAAAAESLLNIDDLQKREEMTLQMGHYLSTHEKMKEPAEVIVSKIRERVNSFAQNPFVGHTVSAPEIIAETPAVEQDNIPPAPSIEQVATPVTKPAPQTETTTEVVATPAPVSTTPPPMASTEPQKQIRNWAERDGLQAFGTREEQIDTERAKKETELAAGIPGAI